MDDRFVAHKSLNPQEQQQSLQYILGKIKPYFDDKNKPEVRAGRLYNLEGGVEHFVSTYPLDRHVSDDILIDWLLADEPPLVPIAHTGRSR